MYCPYCSSKAVEKVHLIDKRDINWVGGYCHSCGEAFTFCEHRINQLHKRHKGPKGFWFNKYPVQRVKRTEEEEDGHES